MTVPFCGVFACLFASLFSDVSATVCWMILAVASVPASHSEHGRNSAFSRVRDEQSLPRRNRRQRGDFLGVLYVCHTFLSHTHMHTNIWKVQGRSLSPTAWIIFQLVAACSALSAQGSPGCNTDRIRSELFRARAAPCRGPTSSARCAGAW